MQNDIASISKLVDKGYDINLVSFEFDIPVQRIIDYRRMIQVEQLKDRSPIESRESKMQIIRNKYYSLLSTRLGNNKTTKKKFTEENKQVNSSIAKIEECIKKIHDAELKEKRRIAVIILSELKKIREYNLTISQAESLLKLLNSNELSTIPVLDCNDRIHYCINSERNRIIQKYIVAIDYDQSTTNDLDELKRLEKKLMSDILTRNGCKLSANALRSQITAKIERIKKQMVISNISNNVSKSISQIISSLADGSVDIDLAIRTIEEEARSRVESKPKTQFSLTIKQEKGQISHQIRKILVEKAESYQINNPDLFIKQLMQICEIDGENALSVLIRNLICRKEYNRAREICNRISVKDENGNIRTNLKNLKKEIIIAELSDTFVKGMNLSRTFEEENSFFDFIKEALRKANISPRAIILSKSDDGMRTITLADVWPEELERKK